MADRSRASAVAPLTGFLPAVVIALSLRVGRWMWSVQYPRHAQRARAKQSEEPGRCLRHGVAQDACEHGMTAARNTTHRRSPSTCGPRSRTVDTQPVVTNAGSMSPSTGSCGSVVSPRAARFRRAATDLDSCRTPHPGGPGHFVASRKRPHAAFRRGAPWVVRPRLPDLSYERSLFMNAVMVRNRVAVVNAVANFL